MCCRVKLIPNTEDKDLIRNILTIGKFEEISSGSWVRHIPEESVSVYAHLNFTPRLELVVNISPAITHIGGHQGHRNSMGVMFEITAKVGEKVGGEVYHFGRVSGCSLERGGSAIIAEYPHTPITFKNLCQGFRDLLTQESN